MSGIGQNKALVIKLPTTGDGAPVIGDEFVSVVNPTLFMHGSCSMEHFMNSDVALQYLCCVLTLIKVHMFISKDRVKQGLRPRTYIDRKKAERRQTEKNTLIDRQTSKQI